MSDSTTFERKRLDTFARYGFEGESRWLTDRDDQKIYTIVRGETEHPTVLLHGGLSQASEWALLAGRLDGDIVIPDRPGCGLSAPVDYRGSDYRKAAADWVADLLDGLGARTATLIGNSMGGYFAIAFAAEQPQRVSHLILPGAPAGLDRKLPGFIRAWGTPGLGRLVGAMVQSQGPEGFRRKALPLLSARPERVPVDLLGTFTMANSLPGVALGGYSMLRTVTTPLGWRKPKLINTLMAELTVPTLFLWGDKDRFTPPSVGVDVVSRMPDAEIEVIADCGHLPQIDEPEIVAEAITRTVGPT